MSSERDAAPAARSEDVQATFCATLVDEWVRAGIRMAVVSPGSRSTPLALALAADRRMEIRVVLDERSAAFFALGIGKATGVPAVLLCTSGTAAANFHPAVIEASLDCVPMLVCTADRPPELHAIGAPQTVDQEHLFGRSVRWYANLGVADHANRVAWRSFAARAAVATVAESAGPGPVHLNLPFREPLVGEVAELPLGREADLPWHRPVNGRAIDDADQLAALFELVNGKRGVLVAGADCGDGEGIHRLAAALDWPVLADPRSGARVPHPTTVSTADAFLRDPAIAESLLPEITVRLGAPFASKVVNQWLAKSPCDVLVDPNGAWLDPNRAASVHVRVDPSEFCRVLLAMGAEGNLPDWKQSWRAAEAAASRALSAALDADDALRGTPTEPAIARAIVRELTAGTTLMVSSSMPVRDVEWYSSARRDVRVLANRGANGIDGIVSTTLGLAASGVGPVVGLLGDLAFLHDASGLVLAAQQRDTVVFVVVDNRGGGIFEFLPQATSVARDRFELLYGTPQATDIALLARAHGLRVSLVSTVADLTDAVRDGLGLGGVTVVIIATDRVANVAVHDVLHEAVGIAVRDALSA